MKKYISIALVIILVMTVGMANVFAAADFSAKVNIDSIEVGHVGGTDIYYSFNDTDYQSITFTDNKYTLDARDKNIVYIRDSVTAPDTNKVTIERLATPSASDFAVSNKKASSGGEISWEGKDYNVQYKLSAASDWKTVASGTKKVSGLDAGTYDVRIYSSNADVTAPTAALLPSQSIQLTVPQSYEIWVGGEEVTNSNTSKDGKWSYDNSTKTLTLSNAAVIEGSHDGAALFIGASSNITTIKLSGNATISSNGTKTSTDVYSYGINSEKAIEITGDGILTVSAKSTGVDISDAVVVSAGTLKIGEGVQLHAVGLDAAKSSHGIFCNNNLENNGDIVATSGKASEKSIPVLVGGTITNNSKGVISATATALSKENCGINSTGKITNSGKIYAYSVVPADAGTDLPESSIGIAASEIETSGTLEAYASDGKNVSTAVSGNVKCIGGTINLSDGTGGTSSTLNGSLVIDTPTDATYTSVTIQGENGAVKDGAVTYGTKFVPSVKAGDATPGTAVDTPNSDTYKNKFLNITNKAAPTVTSITLAPTTLNLDLTTTKEGTLTPTVTMSDGSTYSGKYEWTTSAKTVADFKSPSDPTIVAKGAGEATITVKAGDKTATAKVVVTTAKPATGLSIDNPKLGLKPNGSSTVTATLVPAGSTGTVNWATYSGKNTIVKIEPDSTNPNKCKITGVKNGEEIVVASLAGTTAKAYCTVTVSNSGTAYKITPYYGAWYYDKTDGYTVTLNTTNTVSKVTINGKVMNISTSVNSSNGYQTVTIPYSSMKTLSRGYSQPLVVTFTDNTYVSGKVAVISTKDAPPTGDMSVAPYIVISAISALGAMGAVTVLKKKEK